METFRSNVALQRKLGVEVELISPESVAELVPGLNVTDVLGATFCGTAR
jgi:sarcosine oxidase subunit beta